jgi:hypothetical protein
LKQPATSVARAAITDWLRVRKKLARQEAIARYAREMAGTNWDLDPQLETAAIEELLKRMRSERETRGTLLGGSGSPLGHVSNCRGLNRGSLEPIEVQFSHGAVG